MQFFAVLLSTVTLAVSTIGTPFHVAERGELVSAAPSIIVPQANKTWSTDSFALLCWKTDPQPDSGARGTAYLGNWDGVDAYLTGKLFE